jgi:S-adenosylmethionine:tRNA ribosyltransferase-isomerase
MSKRSIDDYSYDLPPELIADKPLASRDQSKLMVVNCSTREITHSRFDNLPSFLRKGDVLIVNDTRVIPAKIFARRKSGGYIRMLLIKPEATRPGLWQAMVTPIKRLKPGERLTVDTASGAEYELLIADVITAEDGFKRLLVDLGPGPNVFNLLNEIGMAPLPPYILRNKRRAFLDEEHDGDVESPYKKKGETPPIADHPNPGAPQNSVNISVADYASATNASDSVDVTHLHTADDEKAPLVEFDEANEIDSEDKLRAYDLERYQTVFATNPGAVAAPTAGLHFSDRVLRDLEEAGIIIKRVTLHVGPGTFKPVELDVESHFIEPEVYFVSKDTVDEVKLAKKEKRRVIAVGTTSLRALESAAESDEIRVIDGESTNLYVKPGYKFRVVDALITNFHLSKSSLLVLVSTFAGHELIKQAYEQAILKKYRFYSYGDAMFIHH